MNLIYMNFAIVSDKGAGEGLLAIVKWCGTEGKLFPGLKIVLHGGMHKIGIVSRYYNCRIGIGLSIDLLLYMYWVQGKCFWC